MMGLPGNIGSPAAPAGHREGTFQPSRREVLIGSLLLATTAAAQALKPRRMFATLSHDELDLAIPKSVGPYRFATSSGLVLPARDELSEKLYDQVLTRVYLAPDKLPIMALLAYGSVQNLSLELHRPDECYPQQGFTITDPEPLPLLLAGRSVSASVLTARRVGGYVEQVVFWSRIGTHFPATRDAQSWLVARENFAGRMPDGLLVRLSVPTPDREAGVAAALGFIQQLDESLAPAGRRIVLGDDTQGRTA